MSGRRGSSGHGRRARLFRSRRGVLEGLPLTLLISMLLIAVGTSILLELFVYSRAHTLNSLSLATPSGSLAGENVFGAWKQPLLFLATAWAQSGGTIGGVTVTVDGCGIDQIQHTLSNGTAMFLLPIPTLPAHSNSCVLPISALYDPPGALGGSSSQTYSTSLVIVT